MRDSTQQGRKRQSEKSGQDTLKAETEQTRSDAAARPVGSRPEAFGRYKLLESLGQGGMGEVYLAEDPALDRRIALKIPNVEGANRQYVIKRFQVEAKAVANIRHPHVCPVYDVGEVEGVPFLTMAYVEGITLAEEIRRGAPLPQVRAAILARQIAQGMSAAHRENVIHRDLKPGNILIDSDGHAVITDFGLARREDDSEQKLTMSGAIMGTPAYMAPEQVEADHDRIGPQTDVYSVGVILYQMLTGELPFEAHSVALVLAQILNADVRSIRQLRPTIQPRLEEVCLKAMSRGQLMRYASMEQFVAELEDCIAALQASGLTADSDEPRTGRAGDDSYRLVPSPASASKSGKSQSAQPAGEQATSRIRKTKATAPTRVARKEAAPPPVSPWLSQLQKLWGDPKSRYPLLAAGLLLCVGAVAVPTLLLLWLMNGNDSPSPPSHPASPNTTASAHSAPAADSSGPNDGGIDGTSATEMNGGVYGAIGEEGELSRFDVAELGPPAEWKEAEFIKGFDALNDPGPGYRRFNDSALIAAISSAVTALGNAAPGDEETGRQIIKYMNLRKAGSTSNRAGFGMGSMEGFGGYSSMSGVQPADQLDAAFAGALARNANPVCLDELKSLLVGTRRTGAADAIRQPPRTAALHDVLILIGNPEVDEFLVQWVLADPQLLPADVRSDGEAQQLRQSFAKTTLASVANHNIRRLLHRQILKGDVPADVAESVTPIVSRIHPDNFEFFVAEYKEGGTRQRTPDWYERCFLAASQYAMLRLLKIPMTAWQEQVDAEFRSDFLEQVAATGPRPDPAYGMEMDDMSISPGGMGSMLSGSRAARSRSTANNSAGNPRRPYDDDALNRMTALLWSDEMTVQLGKRLPATKEEQRSTILQTLASIPTDAARELLRDKVQRSQADGPRIVFPGILSVYGNSDPMRDDGNLLDLYGPAEGVPAESRRRRGSRGNSPYDGIYGGEIYGGQEGSMLSGGATARAGGLYGEWFDPALLLTLKTLKYSTTLAARSKTTDKIQYDWENATFAVVDLLNASLLAASPFQSNPAANNLSPLLKLDSEASVAAQLHFDWPAALHATIEPSNVGSLVVHYSRINDERDPSSAEAAFERALREATAETRLKTHRSLVDKNVSRIWIDLAQQLPGRERSIDVTIRPVANGKSSIVDLLIVEVLIPTP